MRSNNRIYIAVILVVALLGLIILNQRGYIGKSSIDRKTDNAPAQNLNNNITRLDSKSSNEADVELLVQPVINSLSISFDISLNTHIVTLDNDMTKSAILFDGTGKAYYPEKWEGAEPGGHHISGVLEFSSGIDIKPPFTLVLQDIGSVKERKFTWE